MLYYTKMIHPRDFFENTALPKVDADFSHFVEDMGFEKMQLKQGRDSLEGAVSRVQPGDIIVHQYPTYEGEDYEDQLLTLCRKKSAKFIVFIHEAMAIHLEQAPINNRETERFNQVDVLIAHSHNMELRLRQYGVKVPIVVQGLFGYRTSVPITADRGRQDFFEKVIDTSGNLDKTPFVLDYDQRTPLHLYGKWPKNWRDGPEILKARITHHGEVAEQDLPMDSFVGFGLSWNGWNVPDMSAQGRYTKYSYSYEISHYIAHGLPIIVWRESPAARDVEEYGIGLTLASMDRLDEKLSGMTADIYERMCQNTEFLAPKVRSGYFTKVALKEAVRSL